MILVLAVAAIAGVAAFNSFYAKILLLGLLIVIYTLFSKKVAVNFLLTALLFFFASFFQSYLHQSSIKGTETDQIVRFDEVPNINGSSFQAVVSSNQGDRLLLRYTFQTKKEKQKIQENFHLGQVCAVNGKMEKPEATRNEHAFDYQEYLNTQNIFWVFKSNSNPFSFCKQEDRTWIEKIKTLRLMGLEHIEKVFPSESAGFAAALLFGESDWIEVDTYDAYKKLSLVHILAISGLHVAIVSTFLFYLAIRVGLTREKAKVVLLMTLPVYGVVAGGAPSVVRACVMVMIFILLSLLRMKTSSINVLVLIFLFLLLINPLYLQQVGFQLSFFITFSLLMSSKILQRLMNNKLLQSLAVTVICQLCSMPIILYYFHEFSVWGFILNVIYIPLYTIVLLPLTFIGFIFSIFQLPFAFNILTFLEILFKSSNNFAEVTSQLPYISLKLGQPSLLFVFAITTTIILGFIYCETMQRRSMYICLSIAIAMVFLFYNKEDFSPIGSVVFIDVGQGDSILIEQPFRRGTYLIDTGGVLSFPQEEWRKKRKEFDPGRDILVPYLKSKGIDVIDKLILTHDDQDHIGGGKALLKEIEVKEIIIPKVLEENFQETQLIKEAFKKNIPVLLAEPGNSWRSMEDVFTFLHPKSKQVNSNENSLVLYARINQVKWLFTGDLGEEGERNLLEHVPDLKVDVLKVGHHGSLTSSSQEFIEHIDAEIAVISAGKDNRYGHPHKDVLEVLEGQQMRVYRTDQQGAIRYTYLYNRKGTFSSTLP